MAAQVLDCKENKLQIQKAISFFFYSFIVSSFIVYCVLCMRVCVCVYGLLPDSNKDLI